MDRSKQPAACGRTAGLTETGQLSPVESTRNFDREYFFHGLLESAADLEQSSLRLAASIYYHYRCAKISRFSLNGPLSESSGFFRFGQDLICYGQVIGNPCSTTAGPLFDASHAAMLDSDSVRMPFNITQVADNLRYESYVSPVEGWTRLSWIRSLYYSLRPMLPVSIRKNLQKVYLRGWNEIRFPRWPVDRTLDQLFEKLLALSMQALKIDRIPFVWFWPEGYTACIIMTHDVETEVGRDFCDGLMDIDDSYGIKASFQVVPEKRYRIPGTYLETIRSRGFEVNLHGLDHDGNLFENRQTFLDCAGKINRYAQLFRSRGFRSPVLYRNADWFQELNFSYDMSFPNVGHLDPQKGGCCTVIPYFLPGGMTELPLTTIQDYSLFHILNDYSTTVWKHQMTRIMDGHGLVSFLVHPDYVTAGRAQDVYKALLEEISAVRSRNRVWCPLPREVDIWWRERSQMKLVSAGTKWTVEGPGSDRARVAYACLHDGRLLYEVDAAE